MADRRGEELTAPAVRGVRPPVYPAVRRRLLQRRELRIAGARTCPVAPHVLGPIHDPPTGPVEEGGGHDGRTARELAQRPARYAPTASALAELRSGAARSREPDRASPGAGGANPGARGRAPPRAH